MEACMRLLSTFATALIMLGANIATSAAQNQPAPDTKACAPEERLQPGERSPKAPSTTGENLSDKLARTDGVLCPPNIDPDIRAPTPDVGKTPVIAPPGS